MNLKQSRRKNGRVYLTIEKAYRDANGKPRTKTIKSLGYLDELEKIYDDPIAHFKEVARRMTEEEKASQNVTMVVNMNEELEPSTDSRKNFGYAAILKCVFRSIPTGIPAQFSHVFRFNSVRPFRSNPDSLIQSYADT